MTNSLVSLVLFFLAVEAAPREFPDYIPICHRDQSTINQCLKTAAHMLQPRIAKGIKELSIPPLEPLTIPMIKLEQGTGAVSYKATLTKINVYGLSNYNFREFNGSFMKDGLKLNALIDLPKIRLASEYDIDGRVLLLPIKGNGDFNANITDCQAKFSTTGLVTMKKGKEYLQTKDARVQLNIGGATVHFGNLFNGDPVLSKTTNDFFNQNAKDILNEIKPAIEAVVTMLIDDILNKVFRSTTYDKLFVQ